MPATTPWVSVTLDDVKACVLAELLSLTLSRATAGGQGSPFDAHAPKVVARVRSKVASNPRNQLSADPTLVPPELADQTALLIGYAICLATTTTRPTLLSNDGMKAAMDRAQKDLDDAAAGKFAVSIPPDAQSPGTGVAPTTGTIAVVGGNPRFATRDQLRGT